MIIYVMMASFKKPWTLKTLTFHCCKFIIKALSQQLNMKIIEYGTNIVLYLPFRVGGTEYFTSDRV